MTFIITSIGSITTAIGGSIICAESIVFNATNYVTPVYNTLKRIESMILPSIKYTPRRTHARPSANVPINRSSTGKHVGNYFARKRRESKRSIIRPGIEYYDSKHRPRSVPSPAPSSSIPSIPSPVPSSISSSVPSSVPSSDPSSNPSFDIFRVLQRATDHIGSYVLANQVDAHDTVSISIIPPPPPCQAINDAQAQGSKECGRHCRPKRLHCFRQCL